MLAEGGGIAGAKEGEGAGAGVIEIRVAREPVEEPLGDEGRRVQEATGERGLEGRQQERVVGTAEHQRIDAVEPGDVARHGEATDLRVLPSFLDQGGQERSRALGDPERRGQLVDLCLEGAGGHRAGGGDDADVSLAHRHRRLRRGDRHAQDPARRSGPRVAPLQVPERDAGYGVAGHHHQATPLVEEALHALLGEVEDRVRIPASIGGAARIPQVEKISLRQPFSQPP